MLLKVLSLSMLAAGILLLVFMVTTEGEPGALPLGLVILGIAGTVLAARRQRRASRR